MASRQKFMLGLVAFSIVMRLLPYLLLQHHDQTTHPLAWFYPWNFMPLTALCLYSGANLSHRLWSIAPPMLVLLISNLGIWFLTGDYKMAFPIDGWSIYVCFLFAVLLGRGINKRAWPQRGIDAFARGMLAEIIFFAVTNFVYFLNQTELPYTVAGLLQCYVQAIPFSGRSFLGTAFFSVLFFSPLAKRAAGEPLKSPRDEAQQGLDSARA